MDPYNNLFNHSSNDQNNANQFNSDTENHQFSKSNKGDTPKSDSVKNDKNQTSSNNSDPKITPMTEQIIKKSGHELIKKVATPVPIDYCPMSDEEIKENSLLERLKLESIPKEIYLKVAANFLGDGLITGGKKGLDGLDYTKNFKVWKWLFEDLKKQIKSPNNPFLKVLQKILEGIEQANIFSEDIENLYAIKDSSKRFKALKQMAFKYSQKIIDLKYGETFVFIGGYTNNKFDAERSHALIYEFERNNDDSYNFYVYTSTGYQLTDYHQSYDKLKLKPVIRYTGIPEKHLFLNHDNKIRVFFIQSLIEINVLTVWHEKRTSTEANIQLVLDWIKSFFNPCSFEDYGAITGQIGGTCAPSSTKSWIRRYSGNLQTYKVLMFHTKLRLLISLYRNFKEKLSDTDQIGQTLRFSLRQIARKLLRRIVKFASHYPPLIDTNLAKNAQATAYDILKTVTSHEKKAIEKINHERLDIGLNALNTDNQRKLRLKCFEIKEKKNNEISDKSLLFNLDIKINTALDLPKALNQVVNLCQNYNESKAQNYRQTIVLQIHHLIDQLPIPNNKNIAFWEGLIKSSDLEFCVDKLDKIALFYGYHYHLDTKAKSDAIALTLYAITHFLVIKLDAIKLKDFSYARLDKYKIAPIFDMVSKFENHMYLNRKDFERFQNSRIYFQTFNNQAQKKPLYLSERNISIKKFTAEPISFRGETVFSSINYWKRLLNFDNKLAEALLKRGRSRLKLTQIPDSTIQVALLEESAGIRNKTNCFDSYYFTSSNKIPDNDQDILALNGYGYINVLRRLTHFTNQLIKNIPFDKLHYELKINYNSNSIHVLKNGFYNQSTKQNFNLYDRVLQTLNNKGKQGDLFKLIINYPTAKRNISQNLISTAEGKLLDNTKKITGLAQKILRTTSQWSLTPYQMIMEVSKDFNLLKDQLFQELFIRLFFRSPVLKSKKALLGTGQLIIKDLALRDLCYKFIKKGLDHFSQFQESHKEISFFLKLSFYLSRYLLDGNLNVESQKFDQRIFIKKYLNKTDREKQNLKYLYFYQLLFYTQSHFDKLTDRQLVEIYESWFEYNSYQNQKNKTSSSDLTKDITHFIMHLTSYLKTRNDIPSTLSNALASCFIKVFKLNLIKTNIDTYGPFYSDFPTIFNKNTNLFFIIDLISCQATLNKEMITLVNNDKYHWELNVDYKRVFHENKTKYNFRFFASNKVIFEHPVFGSIKLVLKNKNNHKISNVIYRRYSLVDIHRKFPNCKIEFVYIPPKNLAGMPQALIDDHTFWVPLKGDLFTEIYNIKIKGYITGLKCGKRKYALLDDGRIIKVDSSTGKPLDNLTFVDFMEYQNVEPKQSVTKFESGENILCYSNNNNQLKEIHFPRYTSITNNPLKFLKEKNVLVWNQNTNYFLSTNIPNQLQGKLINYLYLISRKKNNQDILLVPFQKIKERNNPFEDVQLDISNRTPLISNKSIKNPVEQQGAYQYFLYKIDGDNLTSSTLEGKLFLIYIYLAQKDYAKAIKQINDFKNIKIHLNPISKKIFELIQHYKPCENHPESKIVKLHTSILYMKIQDENSNEKITHYFGAEESFVNSISEGNIINILIDDYISVIGSLNNIPFESRFSLSEEFYLLNNLISMHKNILDSFNDNDVYENKEKYNAMNFKEKRLIQRLKHLRNESIHNLRRLQGHRQKTSFDVKEETYYEYSFNHIKNLHITNIKPKNGLKLCDFLKNSPFTMFPYSKNKDYQLNLNDLLYVMKVASGKNSSNRLEMLYQLHLWKHDAYHADDGFMYPESKDLALLIWILKHPDRFPNPNALKYKNKLGTQNFLNDLYESAITYVDDKQNNIHNIKQTPRNKFDPTSSFKYPISNKSAFENHFPPKPRFFPEKDQIINHAPSIDDDTFDPNKDYIAEILNSDNNLLKSTDKKLTTNTISLLESLDTQPERWQKLDKWKSKFTNFGTTNLVYDEFKFDFNESLISKQESNYAQSLKNDLLKLKKEYEIGIKQNTKPHLALSNKNCKNIYEDALNLIEQIKSKCTKIELELLNLVNIKSRHPLQKQIEMARIGGGIDKIFTISDCIDCLLCFNKQAYIHRNKYLVDADLSEIAKLTLRLLDYRSYKAQLQRIVEISYKLINNKHSKSTQQYTLQKLFLEINAYYHFENMSKEDQVALRIFCGQTGMIPYKKQIDLINLMLEMREDDPTKFRDIVIQLIMGGGKTSVIATIVLFLSTRKSNRLGLFIVPSSLFETVSVNLHQSIKKAFNIQITSIDADRNDLTLYTLRRIYEKVFDAKRIGQPIVIKASTIQCLELEFLSQARNMKHGYDINETRAKRYNLLKMILKEFMHTGDALMDEVDLILDSQKEVNFPNGQLMTVTATRNHLLHMIYRCLTSDDLKISSGQTIKDLVRLHEDKQTLMNKHIYSNQICPIIAEYISNHLKQISPYIKNFNKVFIRYASGQLSHKDINEPNKTSINEDVKFLQYIKYLYHSTDNKKKEAANLIALTKHFLSELIPATLSKNADRDYGPGLDKESTKIIPYLSTKVPADTVFGYHWEEACYYYQWAVANPVSETVVKDMAHSFSSAASYYIQKNGEIYSETPEFREFYELTGVELNSIHLPHKLKQATETLSQDIEKRLNIQYELIRRNVNFYTERLTSNGMALVDLLSTRRTMSGTPWNVEGYSPSLANRFFPDQGTEGRILHALSKQINETCILEVDLSSIENYLSCIFKNQSDVKRIRGIIDAGGLFKHFKSNAFVAHQITRFITKNKHYFDKSIQGVLFFNKELDQSLPDTLYFWKIGASKPTRIGGSSIDNLKSKGLHPKNYLVFYDERHTTGTDIPQLPNAINIFNSDENMIRRTMSQGIMRLRQFLSTQNVYIALSKDARRHLYNKGKSLNDIVLSSEKLQSIRKSKNMVKYFQQKIDNLFRSYAVKQLLLNNQIFNKDQFIKTVKKYEKYFVQSMFDEPYLLHGSLRKKIDTKIKLKKLLRQKLAKCSFSDKIKDQARELENHIDAATCLPTEWKSFEAPIGMQQTIQTEQQVQQEVETEIDLELQMYNEVPGNRIRKEIKITKEKLISIINNLKSLDLKQSNLIPLQSQLQKFKYISNNNQSLLFHQIFHEQIFGTKSFFYTCQGENVLPVFHRWQKPAKQILAIKVGHIMRWLLLTEHEASDVRSHIIELYKEKSKVSENIWLIQPDGSLFAHSNNKFPLSEESTIKGLIEINAFCGQADFLDQSRNLEFVEKWLSKYTDLKIHFLKLKTKSDSHQHHIFNHSFFLSRFDKKSGFVPSLFKCQYRLQKEKEKLTYKTTQQIEDNKPFSGSYKIKVGSNKRVTTDQLSSSPKRVKTNESDNNLFSQNLHSFSHKVNDPDNYKYSKKEDSNKRSPNSQLLESNKRVKRS